MISGCYIFLDIRLGNQTFKFPTIPCSVFFRVKQSEKKCIINTTSHTKITRDNREY